MNNGIPKNVLNGASDFKFAIKNWNTINDQSNVNYITEVLVFAITMMLTF